MNSNNYCHGLRIIHLNGFTIAYYNVNTYNIAHGNLTNQHKNSKYGVNI